MNHKKLELIQQMLAKAESTTPAEAEALTEAATKLMARYGIDAAMIDANKRGDSREEIVNRNYFFSGIYGVSLAFSMTYVVRAFGTMRPLISNPAWGVVDGKSIKGARIHVIGYETEVEQTMILITSLHMQAVSAMSSWWKSFDDKAWMGGMEKFKARRDFIDGFGLGVSRKIKDAVAVARVEVDASTTSGPSTELVLADRKTQVDAKLAEMYPRLRNVTGFSNGGSSALADGHSAGKQANIGQKGVTNRKRIEG